MNDETTTHCNTNMDVKRKATEELSRPAHKKQSIKADRYSGTCSSSNSASQGHTFLTMALEDDDPDVLDDESQSGRPTGPSIASSTALTTPTTSSRKFPSDLKTIKCTYPSCPKTFNRPARLTAHLRSHTNDRQFKCTYPDCDKTYLESKHLLQHVKGSHVQERKYTCTECGKSFLTHTRLSRHAAVHAGAERFRCKDYDGCSQSFRKHATLTRHVRTEHMGLKAYPCANESCGSEFDTGGALKRHVEREHGELKFWCDECGGSEDDKSDGEGEEDNEPLAPRVGFTTLALLQAHMRHEHVNCIFCDVKCNSQSELERHVEMYHSGRTVEDRKTVACTWQGCSKAFTRPSNLRVHVRTAHEGLRFICGEFDLSVVQDLAGWDVAEGCGNGFISKMKLEEHIRFVHLKMERPQTTKTAKVDPSAGLLDVLCGVADEARQTVACTFLGCSAKFARYHDMNVHMQRQHHDTEPASELEEMGCGSESTLVSESLTTFHEPQPQPSCLEPGFGELGEFWIGGDGYSNPAMTSYSPQGDDEWRVDEAEMRRLLESEVDDPLAGRLDPSLFDF